MDRGFDADDQSGSDISSEQVSGATPVSASAPAPRARRSAGSRIGRFVVLGHLGEGGMSEVVVAHDPILSRKVAIKLLRGSSRTRDARGRLLREAQAMARLSDPNVVSVYEAGVVGDEVFLVMELIDGESLQSWLAASDRSWRDVLRVFLLAGRGLAAAHRAGLVHRDFKPENVLVGRGERILVTDFGLVSAADANEPSARDDDLAASDPAPALQLSLTRTGELLGTPLYMAPEQHRGEPAQPHTDQFAYAVALYQALYRAHPFAAETHAELVANVLAGRRSAAPSGAVPARIFPVICRALAVSPDGRFSSMDQLLERLAAASAPRVWPRRIATVITVAAAGLGGVVLFGGDSKDAPPCAAAADPVSVIWNDGARQQAKAAFAAAHVPYAMTSLEHVITGLDARARRLADIHVEACEATRVHRTQSNDMLDRRMLCLARSRDALDVTVRIIASADAKTVEHAIDLVAGLGEVDACRDAVVLAADMPPATLRADVDEIERLIAGANANREAGRYAEAIRMAEDALARAQQIHYLPAIAAASAAVVARDLLREGYGERKPQITLLDAVHAADRAHNDNLAAMLWTDFIYMEGVWAGHRTEARGWIPFAEAAIDRTGGDPLLSASLDSAIAGILYWDGDYQQSLERYQRVADVRHRLLGPTAPSTLYALHNLGLARENLGQYSEAVRLHLDALAGTQRVYGPDHPRVADSWQFVGLAQQKAKTWAAARDSLLHALRIRERALGPFHSRTMNIYTQIAGVLIDAGDYDDAAPYALHPFEVSRAHPGAVVWHAVEGLELLVKLEQRRGDLRAARAYLRDAIDLDPGPAPESLGICRPLIDLAQIAYELDDVQSARRALNRALRLEHPGTTEPLPADIWQRAHRLARQLGMAGAARGG